MIALQMENKKRAPEFTRWVLDGNNNPIQVNVWQNTQYRHGSDWDITNYFETLDGVAITLKNWKTKEVVGYSTKEEAIAVKKRYFLFSYNGPYPPNGSDSGIGFNSIDECQKSIAASDFKNNDIWDNDLCGWV